MTSHLRGRARIIGYVKSGRKRRPVWEWSVVNETTGQIVARDNCCLWTVADACNEAAELVDLCREVLIRGITRSSLKAAS